jgi:hypothetical protein
MVHLPSHLYGHTVVKVLRDQRSHPSCSSSLTFLANIGFEQTGRTIRIHLARSRHIMGAHRTPGLNQAGCHVLYPCLESEAKRLCGEAGIRGADGDEFATGKRGLASCRCPHPETMTGEIEGQPGERLNGRRFPIQQAGGTEDA